LEETSNLDRSDPGPISFFQPKSLLLFIAILLCGEQVGSNEIDFTDRVGLEKSVSDDGAVTLTWDKEPSATIILQRDRSAAFTDPLVLYEGSDNGSVITGLEEGEHFFRIGSSEGKFSEPLRIRVEFVSRVQLIILLSLGAVVVLATVLAIVLGHLGTRRTEGGGGND